MFFGRLGVKTYFQASERAAETKRKVRTVRRRRLAALSLAVAVTSVVGVSGLTNSTLNSANSAWARAQEGATNNQPAMTTGELLRMGVDQYNKKQYEEALST